MNYFNFCKIQARFYNPNTWWYNCSYWSTNQNPRKANGSLSPKERIVNARVLFQKYEKFDFILSMKNFRGCDVDKNFAFTFNSKNCKTGIQFFLLEQIFYFADIQDLILADEILASQSENKEFDLFRAKKALIDDDINELKSILSKIDSHPNVSIILRETDIGKGHMTSYTERLKLLECELAVRENEFDKAEKLIKDLSENAQVLSMKESYRKLSIYRKRRFTEKLDFW